LSAMSLSNSRQKIPYGKYGVLETERK
jgi:hypothetical protein